MYRVLHVIDSLGYGGTELQLVLNIERLSAEGFKNYVCYVHGPDHLEPELHQLGVPAYSLGLTGSYDWFKGVSRLRRLVKALNIDLIHTNLFEADVIGGITGRLTKRPVISTIANVCFETPFLVDNPRLSRAKLAFPKYVRSIIAKTCNTHLISVSQTVARSAIKQLRVPPGKTSVIYRALAQRWLDPLDENQVTDLRAELELTDSWPVMLNVGRLIPQKGQRYAIEAMAEVVKQFPRAKLLIAGDGYLRPDLMKLRDRLGLTSQVVFLGRRDDIKNLNAVSDIFMFPSLFEGCPNALIEASAMGNPCAAAKIESIEEVVEQGKTGLLVPPQESKPLAEAVIRLCSNREEAILMGQRAREMALERFTLSKATDKLKTLYGKVLQERCSLKRHSSLAEQP